jgi:hypothetical protein
MTTLSAPSHPAFEYSFPFVVGLAACAWTYWSDLHIGAQTLLKDSRAMESSALVGMSVSSYDSLKKELRKLFARVNDEALTEWWYLRIRIRRKGSQ